KDFPPLCHRLRAGVKNILHLFNECSPQTPLSGWKYMLSRYLRSNRKTDHQDEMDYEMTANKFFIY
ncbi:hypothetical protein, partial [Bacteroides faecis]|uniref:hypothetical protein n=1 Tax=Bacteroides faecis TaxID=674529 RepID=UPI001D094BFE